MNCRLHKLFTYCIRFSPWSESFCWSDHYFMLHKGPFWDHIFIFWLYRYWGNGVGINIPTFSRSVQDSALSYKQPSVLWNTKYWHISKTILSFVMDISWVKPPFYFYQLTFPTTRRGKPQDCAVYIWQGGDRAGDMAINYQFTKLTSQSLLTHIWGSELGRHWFRYWFVVCSATNHYLHLC